MINIKNLNIINKRVLIRVDYNIPIIKSKIINDFRLKSSFETINYCLSQNCSIVLMSHLGRPKQKDDKYSLEPIIEYLEDNFNTYVHFSEDCISEKSIKTSKEMLPKEIHLLENLRFYKEEKLGNKDFAYKLANHGDVYVNDAFGTAHRAHASTSIIADYFPKDKMFGILIENEILSVDKVLNSNSHPLTAIVGGAKVSSKITIISKFLDKVDHLIIGGGMAYTFIKAQNGTIGKSLVENQYLDLALEILKEAKNKGVQIHLPSDSLCCKDFSNDLPIQVRPINQIPEDEMGLDIGPDSIKAFNDVIVNSSLIFWNGPMGVFEMSNFQNGSCSIAHSIVKATENNAFSLIGGGDSVAAINLFKLGNKVSHVSTGGGAMLEYLEGKRLPGIEAINN